MKPAAQVPVFTVRQWIKLGKQIGVLRTGKKRKRMIRDEISGILDFQVSADSKDTVRNYMKGERI
jgi:hypothetical protein